MVDAKKLFLEIKSAAKRNGHADVVIASPFVFLPELKKINGSVVVLAVAAILWYFFGSKF